MLLNYISFAKFWRVLAPLFMVCAITALPAIANATTATAVLAVSATVLSICGVAATPLIFGNYSASSATPLNTTATITATCSSGVPYTLSLNAGIGTGATVAQRVMLSGSNVLNYSIYTNSSYTTLWGDGTLSTSTQGGTAALLPQTYTAYGAVTAGQQAASGLYGDTVTVTLTY